MLLDDLFPSRWPLTPIKFISHVIQPVVQVQDNPDEFCQLRKDGSLPGADPRLREKPSLQTFRRLLRLFFSTRAQNIGRGIHERLPQVVTDLSPPRHEKLNR